MKMITLTRSGNGRVVSTAFVSRVAVIIQVGFLQLYDVSQSKYTRRIRTVQKSGTYCFILQAAAGA